MSATTKTLGGDRLGSGKKMQVHLHNYERSTHDLGYLWRSTMAAGTLVPFMVEVALPGDTFDINLGLNIKTHPTIGPLFGAYKAQIDVFQAPIRLYNSLLHNNALGIGLNMSQVKLPIIELDATYTTNAKDRNNSQINPSCLLAYLGIRGVGNSNTPGDGTIKRSFNAVPLLAFWDIYKNYYANKQEEKGAVIHTSTTVINKTVSTIYAAPNNDLVQAPAVLLRQFTAENLIEVFYTAGQPVPTPETIIFNTEEHGEVSFKEICTAIQWVATDNSLKGTYNWQKYGNSTNVFNWRYMNEQDIRPGQPEIAFFNLDNIDLMRENILKHNSRTTPFKIDASIQPYSFLLERPNGLSSLLSSQEGLPLKTYQSDLFNNWLQTEWIEGPGGISEITAISTVGDSFTLDTLNLSKKVYDMLNRIAVSGGTYDDWLDAVYAHDRYQRAETPMYMGGLSKELVFQEVVSNYGSEGNPLGSLAGKGVMTDKHKGGHVVIKVDEPSYIIGIVSLTPRVDYSQGNKWHVHLESLDDLHKPALDEIGFQDLITEQMAWWDTHWDGTKWVQNSAGKQPAWINYMTNVNQTYGNFAIGDETPVGEMFMTLNRRYESDENTYIKDLTTYIDPAKFNFIFAETAIDAQNFWTQIAVDITARRKMSAKVMPNL